MMEDTYSLQGESTVVEPGKLLDYFDERAIIKSDLYSVEEIFSESSTEFFKLEYSNSLSCFISSSFKIDFPSNWSIFNTIKQALTTDMSFIIEITESDSHHLYSVLKMLIPKRTRLYLVASKAGFYFACPRIENMSFEGKVSKFLSLAQGKAKDIIHTESQIAV